MLAELSAVEDAILALVVHAADLADEGQAEPSAALTHAVAASYTWCDDVLAQLEDTVGDDPGAHVERPLRDYAVFHAIATVEPALEELARGATRVRRVDLRRALAARVAALRAGIRRFGARGALAGR